MARVEAARCCRRIIWINFAGTLLVDSVGVGLAAFGMLNPLFAASIHVSSELAFIPNRARLLPPPGSASLFNDFVLQSQGSVGTARAVR